MRWMIKNSDGKQDAMLTFSVVGFTVVVIKFLLSGVVVKLMGLGYDISFGAVDGAAIAAILGPTLVTYAARRNTDKKYISQVKETSALQQAEYVKGVYDLEAKDDRHKRNQRKNER
jgi:hypothetical protein